MAQILRDQLDIDNPNPQGRDSLDFHELSIWQIKEALEEAFRLGRRSAFKEAE